VGIWPLQGSIQFFCRGFFMEKEFFYLFFEAEKQESGYGSTAIKRRRKQNGLRIE